MPFPVGIMELAYNLFVSAFTAILLSFLVAKLVSLAVSGGEVSGGKVLYSGVDNGNKQKGPIGGGGGGVEEGNLEKKLKVKGSKSKKKRLKKISAETIVVSEFKGKSEPPVSAKILGGLREVGDFVDDCENLGYVEKDLVFPGAGVEFSGVQKVDDYFGLNGPVKNESRLIERLGLETNQEIDLEKSIDFNERRDCRECDDVIRIVPCENVKGTETIEPKKDETIDAQDELDVHNEDFGFCVSNAMSGNVGGMMEISDGEEWEGIERNELEEDFARAMNYVECVKKEGRLNKIGSDVIMQFHDLQKVAMEGPCHEPKISARAKWNSWQKLESMNPEEAMEKYITILSDKVPGWMDSHPSVESKLGSEKDDTFSSSDTALNIPLTVPLACTNEGKPGEGPDIWMGGQVQ